MTSNADHLATLDPSDVALDVANQIGLYGNIGYFEAGSGLTYSAIWKQGGDLEVTAHADDGTTKVFYVTVRSHQ